MSEQPMTAEQFAVAIRNAELYTAISMVQGRDAEIAALKRDVEAAEQRGYERGVRESKRPASERVIATPDGPKIAILGTTTRNSEPVCGTCKGKTRRFPCPTCGTGKESK